jgi:hypothetical protein
MKRYLWSLVALCLLPGREKIFIKNCPVTSIFE